MSIWNNGELSEEAKERYRLQQERVRNRKSLKQMMAEEDANKKQGTKEPVIKVGADKCLHCNLKIKQKDVLTCPRCGKPHSDKVRVIMKLVNFVREEPALYVKQTKAGERDRACSVNGSPWRWGGLQLFLSNNRELYTIKGVQ